MSGININYLNDNMKVLINNKYPNNTIINIGPSDTNMKVIDIPSTITDDYIILPTNVPVKSETSQLDSIALPTNDRFDFKIDNKKLIVTNTNNIGWNYNHDVIISYSMIPKTIYMTYKTTTPPYVFNNWLKLNPDYNIDFSLDNDCIKFLREEFNDMIADMFINIKVGMYKADLWRLCKLYKHGGVYADVDLVPHVPIDSLIKDNHTFYSCMAVDKKSIFQAFIITPPKNPLILQFILSFINNKPHNKHNGPTYDMYDNIKMLVGSNITSETAYKINTVILPLNIGTNTSNTMTVKTFFKIPPNATLSIKEHKYDDKFNITYTEDTITVTRTDTNAGWGHEHIICISIPSEQSIFLFTEKMSSSRLTDAYVSYNNNKILDSRYADYMNAKQKNTIWK